jgi:branched-subunit amino acid transport protein AzlD
MLRGIRTFVREVKTVVMTDRYLPFLILGVICASFAIAFVFQAGPAVVFAVLVMGCIAALMESTAGSNKN